MRTELNREQMEVPTPAGGRLERSRRACASALLVAVGFLFSPWGGRLAFLAFALYAGVVAIVKPSLNWDLLAYAAVVAEPDYGTAEALHAHVYESVRKAAGETDWQKLIDLDAWRRGVYADAGAFMSQLNFYRVKVGYIQLMKQVASVTGLIHAPYVISLFFGLATVAVFFAALRRMRIEAFAILFIPVLLAAQIQWITRVATPDAMSCFLLLAGLAVWAMRSRIAGHGLLAMAVLVRPDSLLIAIGLGVAQLLSGRGDWRDAVGFVVAAACYAVTAALGDHIGWWPHFYYTNVSYLVDMRTFAVPFSIPVYLGAVLNGVVLAIHKEGWLHMYLAVLLAYAGLRFLDRRPFDAWDAVVLAGLFALGARILLFPFLSARLMCPTVLAGALAVGARLSGLRALGADLVQSLRRDCG